MKKLIWDVAVLNDGKYPAYENGKPTKVHSLWRAMVNKCYSPNRNSRVLKTYGDCTVHPDWLFFQNFAEWYFSQKQTGDNYQLDKDLLVRGNRVYGADFCSLVPRQINNLLLDHKAGRGEYPIGVCAVGNRFTATVSRKGKQYGLGTYSTPEAAHRIYKNAKEAYVKEMAIEYKDEISDAVYKSLMAYEVAL